MLRIVMLQSIRGMLTTQRESGAETYPAWYAPVQRTLLCLSKLYRCVDARIFSGLAQEAVAACTISVQVGPLHYFTPPSPRPVFKLDPTVQLGIAGQPSADMIHVNCLCGSIEGPMQSSWLMQPSAAGTWPAMAGTWAKPHCA